MGLLDRYDELPAEDVKRALRPFLETITTPAFGAISKRETDLAAFEMLRTLGLVDRKASLFSLMTQLRITRAKASQILFDIEVRARGGDAGALDEEVREALKATRFAKDGDFFVLEIENPLLQAHLRNRLRELGHISDTSFNSAIVRMPLDAVTDLMIALIPVDGRELVRRALVAAGAPDRSIKGVLKGALKALGSKILGDAADQMAEGVVETASEFLGPIFEGAREGITNGWRDILQARDQPPAG
jgi:hypothetical protein